MENYLNALDYNRLYFLESDVAEFRADMHTLDDELKDGDLEFAFKVFDVFKERVRSRNAYIAELLDQDKLSHRE